ncbi:transglutaminase superfamily protein [Mumia flava]|uniref:Transglutaminase superfamily protein n=1 Tax=Mumia flava TaxID=1348852 RepID=A0A2M9BID2_9ACTN|nr:transglutaminase domain-containing protein [Mumia flava]PJJ57699.1 transglutaminase superfamily protein [Mumia flava]
MSGSTTSTRILDWDSTPVARLAAGLTPVGTIGARAYVQAAHRSVARNVSAVYALDDRQPASVTVARGRGSCSQRAAVLESLARRAGIVTRVRGIAVDGTFWYPRFRRLTWLVPERVVLAWPEFALEEGWVALGELFDTLPRLAENSAGFTNDGETLFDAVATTAVDWDGICGNDRCDLSATAVADFGYFESRDELFDREGQTLSRLALGVADPILARRAPGSPTSP